MLPWRGHWSPQLSNQIHMRWDLLRLLLWRRRLLLQMGMVLGLRLLRKIIVRLVHRLLRFSSNLLSNRLIKWWQWIPFREERLSNR